MNRETGTKTHRLVTPHTNTFPALVGCGGEMAPGSAGPHPPVRTACSSHCSSHLTDRTSFSTNHREGPAKVVAQHKVWCPIVTATYPQGPLRESPSCSHSPALTSPQSCQLLTGTVRRTEDRGHSLLRPWPRVGTGGRLAGQVAPSSESN